MNRHKDWLSNVSRTSISNHSTTSKIIICKVYDMLDVLYSGLLLIGIALLTV